MKVENMTSSKGNEVPNQFVVYGAAITDPNPSPGLPVLTLIGTMFQSYDSNIAFVHDGKPTWITDIGTIP